MKVFQVELFKGACKYITNNISEILDAVKVEFDADELDIGDSITITAIEMSENEFKELPDWGGP